jgi:NAD(P)-dependent dehydrogenase (short-subunit alcohol dehydrogenase family)
MTEEKVAIVTGASHGIGAALVSAFLDAGYKVVANARAIEASTNPNLVAIDGDIRSIDTAQRIVSACVDRFSRIDTLVNNAGIYLSKPFTEYTQADYDEMLSTNLAGFFHLTQRVLKVMERQGFGHIVTMTAALAEQPLKASPAALSSLTKGGLDAATKALAIEYASRGIRVNAVAPGIIDTTLTEKDAQETPTPLQPLGRMGRISDIVGAVMYLERAPFVTGEIAHVDGGQTAGYW